MSGRKQGEHEHQHGNVEHSHTHTPGDHQGGEAGSETMRTSQAGQSARGEARVPVAEERLNVEKRATELGEVQVHKTVTEEQQTVPVELRREEVHVERVNVGDRPLQPGENAFQEGTIRVPVRGEEAVVNKEAVVTGEVVINKGQTTEQQSVAGTVRREQVEVDRDYEQHRPNLQQHFTQRQGQYRQSGGQWASRTWEEAEPTYQYGYSAARNQQYQSRQFEDVEPDLRRDYETRNSSQGSSSGGGDAWQHLREEVREGWNRARNS